LEEIDENDDFLGYDVVLPGSLVVMVAGEIDQVSEIEVAGVVKLVVENAEEVGREEGRDEGRDDKV